MSFPATIELSEIAAGDGSLGFVINGVNIADASGISVAIIDDVNGDGIDDVLVGAHYADRGEGTDAGEAYVVFGSESVFGGSLDLSALDGTNGFVIYGADSYDEIGSAVSSAGDINGDGIGDIIVGGHQFSYGRAGAGASYVIFGNADGFPAAIELASLDGNDGFVINGIDPEHETGRSVSSAGDFNGDGIDDLLIGTYRVNENGPEEPEVYVVFGSAEGFDASVELSALDGNGGFAITLDGTENSTLWYNHLGFSLSSAGDINGDGLDDIIIGAPGGDPAKRYGAGQSYVIFGSENSFASRIDVTSLDGSNGFVINGIESGDVSGYSVAGAGDVNGDGIDDLLIGTKDQSDEYVGGECYIVFGSTEGFGANFELSALDGSNGFVLVATETFAQDGLSVSGAGDVNGDGLADFIIGASFESRSYVVFGNENGFPARIALDSLDGSNGFIINGVELIDYVGWSVSGGGDVNGDGYDDVIVSSPGADAEGVRASGQSYVIYGRASTQTEGTSGGDTLTGAAGNDELNGYAGNDTLIGGWRGDVMSGGAGDDFYEHVTFPDTVIEREGEGNDTVRTRADNYTLGDNVENLLLFGSTAVTASGNAQGNHIVGTHGGNILHGLGGRDVLEGLAGRDTLYGAGGSDTVLGGRYADTLFGGPGADTLDGGTSNDTLHGGDNHDTLHGGDHHDILSGNAGDDLLGGGSGRDRLTGGTGADVFTFADGDLAGRGANSADRILDFSQAEGDMIDLSALDAIAGTPEIDRFAFIGAAAFSGTAGELRYDQYGSFTMVQGDTDGDGVMDFAIRVDGLVDLVAADFQF